MNGIIEKIKNDTKNRIKGIESERDKEIDRILDEAREKARAIKIHSNERAQKEAEMEEKRIISRANLQAKKARAELVDSLLESILLSVEKEIEKLRKENKYRERLNALIGKALEEIPSKHIVIEVSQKDAKILKPKKVSGKTIKIQKSNSLRTGAIVRSKDNKVRIDCTFSTLLNEKKQALKKEMVTEIK